MADISGPCRTLPGSLHVPSVAATCDEHEDRLAVKRVQGETDSFGAEYIDMCQECFDKYEVESKEADHSGTCEWCNSFAPRVRPRRDLDEGSYGRVYNVCDACIKRENDDAREELSSHGLDDFSNIEDDPEYDEPGLEEADR